MTLRRKLLLVALCTLVLPLTGWFYVRQMESLLRRGQAQALIASAHALARSLVAIRAPLPDARQAWYVQRSVQPIAIDGYGDDWAPLTPWAQPIAGGGKLLLATDRQWLDLYVTVPDTSRVRADVDAPGAMRADHLLLTLARGDIRRRYLLASAAPGRFIARPLDAADGVLPDRIPVEWQEDGSGYQVELRLPRSLGLTGLGIAVYDAARPASLAAAPPVRPLLQFSQPLSAELARLAPDGVRARLLAPDAWLMAQSGHLQLADSDRHRPGWLASLIYRALIAAPLQPAVPWTDDVPRISLPEVKAALEGRPDAVWREGEARGMVVLSVAVPVTVDGHVQAALTLEQASRSVPLLANRALLTLLLASLGVLLVAGVVLFAFATRLGLRLARLRDAAETAQANDGRYEGTFPLTEGSDEVADLARSFARLFDAVGGYTDYLRTLASKLSHELNTPLAIVKSSLDNIEQAGLGDEARPYLERARDGVARLGALVRAMSETSRMERAIAAAEPEEFDLVDVVRGCAEAYRPLAGTRRVETRLPATPVPFHGAPELIAQALDKLFDNALSFTPEDGWICLSVRAGGEGAEIEVANQGPPLPPSMQGRLFDSLVSVREERGERTGAPHLGLGLYVVRLIAERHGGEAVARTQEDGKGVAFTLRLRGMPRERLG